jgi:hypothetical protein
LIKRLPFDTDACNLVRGFLTIAANQAVKTVAEYLENDNIHQCVSGLGIDTPRDTFSACPKNAPDKGSHRLCPCFSSCPLVGAGNSGKNRFCA